MSLRAFATVIDAKAPSGYRDALEFCRSKTSSPDPSTTHEYVLRSG